MKKCTKPCRGNAGRKPIRPIERQKMRPWLVNLLNEDVPSLKWEAKKEGTFRISWRHAARQGWNPTDDADLFERWARHTGKFMDGDDPDPKRWKANFRCALNSLPDVEEMKERGLRKGNNAFKIYKFLDEKKMKKKNRQNSTTCAVNVSSPKRSSKRLQDKPHRRFHDSDFEDDNETSDSEECRSPAHSESGSEPELISERNSRLSTESSELPVFTKICRESDLSIFKEESQQQKIPTYQQFLFSDWAVKVEKEEDSESSGSNMTEEELVELILNVESPGSVPMDTSGDENDIWQSVAADVTVGELEPDNSNGFIIIEENDNVITEHVLVDSDMIYTSLDPSLL